MMMNNQEAIKCIEKNRPTSGYIMLNEALDMAITALKEQEGNRWIPVSERFPENDGYILLSFENFSLLQIGRYEEDAEGGAFYLGDEDEPLLQYGLFVNAWRPLPKPYRKEE